MTAVLPDDQVRIGNIRKILTDAALLRAQSAGIKRDVLLLSNDADNKGISRDYVNSFVKYFSEHPDQEGGVGDLCFDHRPCLFPCPPGNERVRHAFGSAASNVNVTLFGATVMKSSYMQLLVDIRQC
jgi:hypothetical protein